MNKQVVVSIFTEFGDDALFSYTARSLAHVPATGDRVKYDGIFKECAMPVASVTRRTVTHMVTDDGSMLMYGVRLTVSFPFDETLRKYIEMMKDLPKKCDQRLTSNVFLKEHEAEIGYDDVIFISVNYKAFGLSENMHILLGHYLWKMKYSPFSI